MSFTADPALVPDRDRLPLKKRDQRPSPPPPPPPLQQCDAATFKAPYPYKSLGEVKTKPTGPFQPVPRRVPALYQPWTQTQSSTRSKPQHLSAFRDHHGWAEWREFSPLHPGWTFSPHYQHQLSGSPALHLVHPHHSSRFSPVSLVTEGFQRLGGGYSWEQLKTFRDKSLTAERPSSWRSKGPYVRRRDRKVEPSPPSLSTSLPHSPHLHLQHDAPPKSATVDKHPRVAPDDQSSNTSRTEDASGSSALPSSERPSSSSSSSSPNRFPWLLPHFEAGSLIELRDGRLRRVEHLQTEDFLLGSLTCPDLQLSCCTVQSISPSASSSSSSSSSISRLLILLHDQQSQELVDVYVEYPFFVRGRGWSSCCPQRTARLCGLRCRQLSVGDICLALTPLPAPRPPPSAPLEPKTSERGCESLKAPRPRVPPGKKESEGVRRRHCSAPELRHPGTDC